MGFQGAESAKTSTHHHLSYGRSFGGFRWTSHEIGGCFCTCDLGTCWLTWDCVRKTFWTHDIKTALAPRIWNRLASPDLGGGAKHISRLSGRKIHSIKKRTRRGHEVRLWAGFKSAKHLQYDQSCDSEDGSSPGNGTVRQARRRSDEWCTG